MQLQEDLKQRKADREEAKTAMKTATELRRKEAAAFAKETADAKANIGAINSAVAALEKGMAGGFLQTGEAQVLQRFATSKPDMPEADRQEILAFLSSTQASGYAPQAGEITGILKQMGDEMSQALADATAAEDKAIAN